MQLAKKNKQNKYLFIDQRCKRIKSRYAIYSRLSLWGKIVNKRIGTKGFEYYYREKLKENKITFTKLANLNTGKYDNENYAGMAYNDLHISRKEWNKLFNDERLDM